MTKFAALASAARWLLQALWGAVLRVLGAKDLASRTTRRAGRSGTRRSGANGATQNRSTKGKGGEKSAGDGVKAQATGSTNRQTAKAAVQPESASGHVTMLVGGPETTLEAAASAAAAAQEAVERANQQHLTTLLKQPARERLNHLRDPALTAADRRRLCDLLGAELPRRAVRKRRRAGVFGLHGLRQRWRAVVAVAVLAALCAGLTLVAWRNTAVRTVVSDETWVVTWTVPGGRDFVGAWRAGYPSLITAANVASDAS